MLNEKCDDDGEARIRVEHAISTYKKLHISGPLRSANGPEDQNYQVLHLASVTIWCGNLVIEDQLD